MIPDQAIPARTKAGIDRYVDQRVPPGGFLMAVLSNDLTDALGRADEENRANLFAIVNYCYNEIPFTCWGSPEKICAWLYPAPLGSVPGATHSA